MKIIKELLKIERVCQGSKTPKVSKFPIGKIWTNFMVVVTKTTKYHIENLTSINVHILIDSVQVVLKHFNA